MISVHRMVTVVNTGKSSICRNCRHRGDTGIAIGTGSTNRRGRVSRRRRSGSNIGRDGGGSGIGRSGSNCPRLPPTDRSGGSRSVHDRETIGISGRRMERGCTQCCDPTLLSPVPTPPMARIGYHCLLAPSPYSPSPQGFDPKNRDGGSDAQVWGPPRVRKAKMAESLNTRCSFFQA